MRGGGLVLVGGALALGACGPALKVTPPGPDVPRISGLQIVPERVAYGCPAQVQFRFEHPEGSVVRAIAHWRVRGRRVDSGILILPVERGAFAGRPAGDVTVWVTPQHAGDYRWEVQVEDAAERTSNVLEAELRVESPPWRPAAPVCGGLGGAGLDGHERMGGSTREGEPGARTSEVHGGRAAAVAVGSPR